ncbi:class I SAM-dependent DNA methyltransferase [Levilactobacillus bambusae]|uniref:SAM-dependent methyltransferase n=1 Tax=Levilactobacillus bambusae TaxID=2024736 RepID=A0A2V1N1X4_9LACO|nr:class I SAM-dependent methyltransferase [Levilactobacillus bambusae]PWG01022.1 SAM-dependent methyltransferase [Levilactobacillus bambusae]
MENYTTFAELYDELFDPAMYDQWLDFVVSNVKPGDGPVLDLACGTGRLAVMMAKAGYEVSGLDLSAEMLAIADRHAWEVDVTIPWMQGNLLDLAGVTPASVVTCFDDSLNYLADEEEVGLAFSQVEKHLVSGGTFMFDVITPYQTDDLYPGYMYNYHDQHRAFLWSSYGTEIPHEVEHDLTFFVYNEEKQGYDKLNELHHERTYSLATYQELLAKAGFSRVEVSADFGNGEITPETTRWFFTCHKEA